MPEWINGVRFAHSPWEGPEDTHFTVTVRNPFVRGAQHS